MVIAGPGTGKTHVILERVKDLILNQYLDPHKILCLTFNVKAKDEMNQRIKDDKDLKSQNKNRLPYVKTYNSFGNQFSASSVDQILIRKWFYNKISNTDFQYISTDYDSKEEFIQKLQSVIGAFRKELISPEILKQYCVEEKTQYEKTMSSERTDSDKEKYSGILQLLELHELYNPYLEFLKKENKIDFDDQLIDCDGKLSSEESSNKRLWLDHFEHVLVDEYQDNNYLHTKIAKLLSSVGNITVVGDPDQTINTFQGANTANFEDFKNHFKNIAEIKTVNLVENYRSTGKIVESANYIISKIKIDERKSLITHNRKGEKIKIISCDNYTMNCEFVIQTINELKKSDYDYSDIAILCRTNKKAKLCYEYLSKKIPSLLKKSKEGHVTIGTVHFFKGMEYKVVFVLDVSAGSFPIPFRDDALKVPVNLRHYKPKSDDIEEHDDEERRIFYVALTRAKEKLFFVCSTPVTNLSGFLQEFEVISSNFEYVTHSGNFEAKLQENLKSIPPMRHQLCDSCKKKIDEGFDKISNQNKLCASCHTNSLKPKFTTKSSTPKPKMSRDKYISIQSSAGIDPDKSGKEWDAKYGAVNNSKK